MNTKRLSIRSRVFISMVLLILISSILIGVVTIFQYNQQAEDYNSGRLARKENAVILHLQVELARISDSVQATQIRSLFKDKINEIAKIHRMEIEIHAMDGNLLISSNNNVDFHRTSDVIVPKVLNALAYDSKHRFVEKNKTEDKEYHASYRYLFNNADQAIGILHLPYLEDSAEQEEELRTFLKSLALGFFVMFLIGMVFAYFISSYITRSLKTVSDKLIKTRLEQRNEKIELSGASNEIYTLIDAYNNMVDELEDSAVKLAKSEREQAWREMAKQVAHEIKNPLTPMRLTVQSFERKFDANDADIEYKLKEFSKTLIQQIDVMSSIASAFSDFAKMPGQKREQINLVDVVKHATELFTESNITFDSTAESIVVNLDKLQVVRIITNLIKNADQATETVEHPEIKVALKEEKKDVLIYVSDNGKGISEELKSKVFEPKFTTKTSGMGLGLPMIKNIIEAYGGTITFTSKEDYGTTFKVLLPKE